MAILELNSFLAKIKAADFEGRYIFAGDEEFLMKHYLDMLRRAVVSDEAFAAFNHTVFDGGEIDFAALTDAIESPPMMSEYKLVEWRHADFSRLREDELSALEELLLVHDDHPSTVLAFLAIPGSVGFGTAKKAGKLIERFPSISFLRFDTSNDRQLHAWIERHFAAEGLKISLSAASAIVASSGHAMNVLKGEIDKLSAYVHAHGRGEVTVDDVREVCATVLENDTFAFSNAIGERNRAKAFSALEELKMKRIEPLAILASIRSEYAALLDIMLLLRDGYGKDDIAKLLKMNPYRVGIYINNIKKHTLERLLEITDALLSTDEGMKSGGVTGYTAIELFLAQYI